VWLERINGSVINTFFLQERFAANNLEVPVLQYPDQWPLILPRHFFVLEIH
jgi:hypothetical protein